ncbi:unnamed protein product [Medioppia subpectinata]|uniref:non-specific serine/threonine protein kinase n=1 Tax=Medioppia subpectinata TaxID=1979941 RepID=A0A7R9Q1P5_9ACAR|nr:unnamed protein product [Medioppia subpectinata]CAG2109459.1 unnamed protein product [Medioppia subpectinata]
MAVRVLRLYDRGITCQSDPGITSMLSVYYVNAIRVQLYNMHHLRDNFILNMAANDSGMEVPIEVANGRYNTNYNEFKLIGYGGYGKVYHVESKMNNNVYAIKQLELLKVDPNWKYINREVNLVQSCDHINVIKYYEAWREQGDPENELDKIYIMMDFCNYNLHNVSEFITNVYKRNSREVIRPVNYFISINLVEEILNGLNYLHGMDIMHRDVNQSNILVKQQGDGWVVKICDFGFAKLEESGSLHTVNVGTLTYQAPEVKWGGLYNKLADIFSLATKWLYTSSL